MRELFIVGNQVSNVHVAVVLFDKDVFTKLISVKQLIRALAIYYITHTCR